MKIAIFTDAYLPNVNGVSFSVDVFSQLLSKENEIEIYAPTYTGSSGTGKKGQVVIRRYYSVPIPTYKDAHLTLPDVLKIYNQLEDFNPDVVHIQTPGSLGLIGILAAKMLKKPIVGTYHTLISEVLVYASIKKSIEKYLQAIEKVGSGAGIDLRLLIPKKEVQEAKKKDSLSQRVTWSLVNRVYGYCDIVICPSDAIKRELAKRQLKRRLEVVSNGVDLKMFPMKKTIGLSHQVIHVGRLGFEKNVDVVIKAFAEVIRQVPEAKLVIAGDGPARKDVEKLANELGVAKKVQFLGTIKREKLAKVYASGDVFITASTMETQGMVVLEAMACGLGVIGVKKYALPDLIKDGSNGYLVKPGNYKSMADKMKLMLTSSGLAEKMGREARRTAEKHNVEVMARKLLGLYEEAMLIKFGTKN